MVATGEEHGIAAECVGMMLVTGQPAWDGTAGARNMLRSAAFFEPTGGI